VQFYGSFGLMLEFLLPILNGTILKLHAVLNSTENKFIVKYEIKFGKLKFSSEVCTSK
jgi:hypothetical protein